jgi:protein involved in polysaccharide export with SLBB domain
VTVYSRNLFDESPTTFAPVDRVPVPANYVIGPGDELLVRIWGKVELEARVTVDRKGQIFLPKVGTLTVASLRYEQLESFMRTAVAKLYKDFEINVSIGQLRSIQIFVLGSARQPGVYTVSSLSTLVNALFASGGPSATGSMRHIQLRRANQLLTELDLYNLLRRGDKSNDVQLLSGDVVFIPGVGPQVAVLGSVKEAGIYELKDGGTVQSALRDVGGLSNLASADRALLERVENHRRRQVDEFALDDAGMQRQLRDGDILRIFPISPQFENAVTLRGSVSQPGRYLWHDGMRVSDLIRNREALLTRDYWNQQNFLAGTVPPTSYPPDANGSNAEMQSIQTTANPKSPSYYPRPEGGTLSTDGLAVINPDPPQYRQHWDRPTPQAKKQTHDVIEDVSNTSAEINWEYAAIERRDRNDLSTRILAFNLGHALDQPASPDNLLLEPGDILTIFSRKDVPLPQDKHASFVRIGGEVNAPGVYRIDPGETLRRLVERAGGLTAHSYLYGSQLSRESTRTAQEQELRLATAQMQRDLAARYASANSLMPGNTAEQQAQFSAQQAVINQLSAIHPTGRIVLDLKPEAVGISDIPDFPLEDGDTFFVPARLNTVQVSGAVYNENAFRYELQKRVSTYLKAAGGPTRQADVKRAFLIRADGTVISRQHHDSLWNSSFDKLRVLPGDSIVIPTKLKSPTNFMQQLPFLTQILSQTAMTGAVIGTTR